MISKRFGSGLQRIICACFALIACGGARAQTLFYSGDQANSGNVNQFSGPGNEQTFTEFKVTDPGGWKLSSLYSNDFQVTAPLTGGVNAEWSIRTGMAVGNGGTTLYSGTNASSLSLTGRTTGGFVEYTVGVNISSLGIILAPGDYWLQVSPIGGNTWYNSTTMGANGINKVNGHNGLSLSGGNYIARHTDYSMGINGQAVTPEGSSLAMIALGGLPIAIGFRRKFRSKKA